MLPASSVVKRDRRKESLARLVGRGGGKRPWSVRAQQARTGLLLSSPAFLTLIALFLFPLALAFWMSLHDWPLLGEPSFNAPTNYTEIRDNSLFVSSILFTLKYTLVVTVIYVALALTLALLVQNQGRFVGFFRTAYLLPAAVGLASSALLFYALYNNEFGPVDDLLRAVGLAEDRVEFIGTPNNAFISTVVMVSWRFAGFFMIILLTGLQAIPVDVYEAARVDGSSWFQTLRHITLPLLKPTLLLVLILSVTGSLLAFEPFYVLTAGGPSNSTVTMVIAMFREAFTLFDLGSAAAIAMVLLAALVTINLLQLKILGDED